MRMRMSLSTFSSLPLSTLSTMVPRRKETPTWVIPLHPEHTSTIRHFFLVICQILMDSVSLAKKWKFYVNLRLGSPQVRWTSVLLRWLEFFPGNISYWKFKEDDFTWGGNHAADICIGAPMAIGPPIALMIDPERSLVGIMLGICTGMAASCEGRFKSWK